MRQTELFTKTRKEAPSDEVSRNAQLLIRAGFVHKEMAGVYSFLPLGVRTLRKIEAVVREEMEMIGGGEVCLSALQDKGVWEATGRWEEIDVWFKALLQNGTEVGFGTTHEEPITRLMREQIRSYRDLPRSVFQIQTKFRNEARAKSGVIRTREFSMKDLYSFHATQEDLDAYYEKVIQAYEHIFTRVGLGERTIKTFASGGAFSKYSHEFQTLSPAGEDTIYLSREKKMAVNKEVYTDAVLADLGLHKEELHEERAIETGNIFKLGTRFSKALGCIFLNEKGEQQEVVMGCYGIGPSRILGVVAEVLSDEKGLVWPKSIAPFQVHLVRVGEGEEVVARAGALYENFLGKRAEVLYDDRDLRAGEKFADADLIGIPLRVVVSDRTQEGVFETVDRQTGENTFCTVEEILARVQG